MLFYFVLCCIFTFKRSSAEEASCGGMLESDQGSIQIEPSKINCLWIIKLTNTQGFHLDLSPLMAKPIVIVPEQNISNGNVQYFRATGSKKVSHQLEGKSLALVVPSGNEKTTLNWSGVAPANSEVSSRTQFVRDSEVTLQWEHKRDGTDRIFWAFEHDTTGQFNWNLTTELPICDQENTCESIAFTLLQVTPDGNVNEIQNTCEGPSKGSLSLESRSQVLVLLHINSPKAANTKLELTWKYEMRRIVEGISVATLNSGLVLIPWKFTEARNVASQDVKGMAFDWGTSRMYWSEDRVGIKRYNFNSTVSETLSPGPFEYVYGMAVDSVSGNLYYGSRSRQAIRVCNSNDAKNCSTIVSNSDMFKVYDIALHRSKGLLFWSISNMSVVRANLDGSNATVILQGQVYGIDIDELTERLYWGSSYGIGSCDFNGQDPVILPNVTTEVRDVAINGDEIYYTNWNPNSILAISKQGTGSRLVADLTDSPRYIAFFGRRLSKLPKNPCEVAKCTHLCILASASSFRCVCPDGKELTKDKITCSV